MRCEVAHYLRLSLACKRYLCLLVMEYMLRTPSTNAPTETSTEPYPTAPDSHLLSTRDQPFVARPPKRSQHPHITTTRFAASQVPSQDFEILLLDHNCGSGAAEIITRSLHVSARAMTLHGFRGLQTGESARHVSEDEEDVGWRGGETLT